MTLWQFEWLYLPYAIPQFLAFFVGILLGIFVWRSPGTIDIKRAFTGFLVPISIWSLGYGLELLSPTLEAKIVWVRFEYFGIAYAGCFWLVYALVYRQKDRWLRPGWIIFICLIPTLTQFMVWTNDIHHLHWAVTMLDTSGPIPMFTSVRGGWFWIHAISSYVFLLIGTGLLVRPFFNGTSIFRAQSRTLIAAALLPLIGNIIFVTQIIPTGGLDPTPVLFSFSSILLISGENQLALFSLTPTANRLVLANMQDGVFVVDQHDRFVSINASAERIISQSRNEIIGKSIAEVFKDRFPKLVERYGPVEELADEVDISRSDGVHTYDIRISTMYSPRGTRRGRIAVLRDITAQKQTVNEVQEQRKLAMALRASAEAVISSLEFEEVLDKILELVAHVVSYETSSLFLVEGDEAEIVRVRSSSPDKQELAASLHGLTYKISETATLRTQSETGEPLLIDDVRTFDGWITFSATNWVRSYVGVPIRVGQTLLGFLNLYSDQIQNYSTEDADRLQSFALQAAIAIRNAKNYSDIEEINQRLIMLSLITTVGTVNVPFEDLVKLLSEAVSMMTKADIAFVTRWDERSRQTVPITASGGMHEQYRALPEPYPGQPSVTEAVIHSGDIIVIPDVFNTEHISPRVASRFPTQSMIGIPLFANDEAFGALLLGYNTPRLFSEDELALAEQAANLMALVITSSRSMEELQLRNRELDAFSHTVAHDLKAPLQGISGYLELIRLSDKQLSEETERHVDSALRFTRKIGEIVDAMMLLAGLREQEYAPEIVAVAPVIEAALERFQLDIADKAIEIVLQDSYPDVMGHGPWLEEVFANLISNSIKYMGAGKKTSTITITARALPERVVYEVRDNGVGISADKIPTVFRLFSRFHQTLAEGTGLGMSIVQRIITRMDGEIGVESEAGEGTTVWFILDSPRPQFGPPGGQANSPS